MEISDIIKYKEFQEELDKLVERYFDSLNNYGETYLDWHWSSEPDTITIIYGFWNYHDEWDHNEHYVTFDELIKFSKNETKD